MQQCMGFLIPYLTALKMKAAINMKKLFIIITITLGTTVITPSYAQDNQPEKPKAAKKEVKADKAEAKMEKFLAEHKTEKAKHEKNKMEKKEVKSAKKEGKKTEIEKVNDNGSK